MYFFILENIDMSMKLKCIKTWKEFPFALNFFNNPEGNDPKFSNLILDWWHKVDWYQSLVPFKKEYISYWAKNSPLINNKTLWKILWLSNIKIKDESFNPYWTHKDRRSEYIVNVAIENKIDKIVCLTAWNAGYSLSRYCARAGIDYTSLVFPWVSDDRKETLKERWQVITIDWARYNGILRPRDFQQIVAEYDKYEREKEWNKIRAVTNSFEPISINAYKELLYEIKDEEPDYVVVPCGSGDILIGLWLGIKELGMKTKIIWVWPQDEHPLKYALKYGTDEYQIDNYRENSHAEKLTTPFTAVLPILYKIFSEKWNIYTEVTNEEILKTREILLDIWIRVENSAVPPFATFLSKDNPDIDPNSKVIIISTGKGIEN